MGDDPPTEVEKGTEGKTEFLNGPHRTAHMWAGAGEQSHHNRRRRRELGVSRGAGKPRMGRMWLLLALASTAHAVKFMREGVSVP